MVYLYPTLVNKPHHIATLPLKAISPSSFVLSLHVSFRNDTFWVGTIHGTIHQKMERYMERYSLDRHGPCNRPMCCSMPNLTLILHILSKGHLSLYYGFCILPISHFCLVNPYSSTKIKNTF